MVAKPILTAEEAIKHVKDGMTVMVGGFLGTGSPDNLIKALHEQKTQNMTLVCNDTALYNPDKNICNGVAPLIVDKQFSKVVVSHIGTNRETGRQMNANETDVVLVPQGTLAEQVRAGGFGLGGILTPTGLGTEVENGKQIIEVKGKKFILEEAIDAEIALVKAKKADKSGNLVFSKSCRNFNPLMATAAKITIVEAEEIVEVGEIDPEDVITPGIFVTYLVQSK